MVAAGSLLSSAGCTGVASRRPNPHPVMTTLSRTFRRGLAALTLALPATAGAQLTGGVKTGTGQSLYTGKHEFAWKVAGPNTTVFLNWTNGSLSQQLEVGDSHRLGVSSTGGSILTFSATYVDVLLLSKFTFKKRLGTRPFLLAGPSLVYGLECNLEFVTGGFTSETPCDENTGVNRMDIGVAVAGGLEWALGAAKFSAELRGSTSFRSVVVPLESQTSRSVAWSVLGGISVPMSFGRTRRAPPTGVPQMPTTLPAFEQSRPVVSAPSLPSVPELAQSAGAGASSKLISVTAVDADARSLLIAIAREAGISMVVSMDVRRSVSVSFKDTPADEALRAIIAQAGLTLVNPPSSRPLPIVVYYQLPVDVNEAPVETISARFGVSADLAKWLVESRAAPPPVRQNQQP
jgi:hypothetical protein